MEDSVGMKLVEDFLAEEKMISEYLQKESEYEAIAEKVREHFRLELDELLEEYKTKPVDTAESYFDLSVKLRNRCPDHVQKCFMNDAIKQAFGGKINKAKG